MGAARIGTLHLGDDSLAEPAGVPAIRSKVQRASDAGPSWRVGQDAIRLNPSRAVARPGLADTWRGNPLADADEALGVGDKGLAEEVRNEARWREDPPVVLDGMLACPCRRNDATRENLPILVDRRRLAGHEYIRPGRVQMPMQVRHPGGRSLVGGDARRRDELSPVPYVRCASAQSGGADRSHDLTLIAGVCEPKGDEISTACENILLRAARRTKVEAYCTASRRCVGGACKVEPQAGAGRWRVGHVALRVSPLPASHSTRSCRCAH